MKQNSEEIKGERKIYIIIVKHINIAKKRNFVFVSLAQLLLADFNEERKRDATSIPLCIVQTRN